VFREEPNGNAVDIIFADVNYHRNITKDVDGNIDIASLNK